MKTDTLSKDQQSEIDKGTFSVMKILNPATNCVPVNCEKAHVCIPRHHRLSVLNFVYQGCRLKLRCLDYFTHRGQMYLH